MATRGNKKLSEQQHTGTPPMQGACVVIVRTDWNASILDALEKGCRKILRNNGIRNITTITVPGAVEIPFGIRAYWEAYKYRDDKPKAFIALGCVIQGDTPHFDYVCRMVSDGVTQLNLILPIPTIFGVLTVSNEAQARERIGGKHGHKGEEAAFTAMKMMHYVDSLKEQTRKS